jgi:hypothetical protein
LSTRLARAAGDPQAALAQATADRATTALGAATGARPTLRHSALDVTQVMRVERMVSALSPSLMRYYFFTAVSSGSDVNRHLADSRSLLCNRQTDRVGSQLRCFSHGESPACLRRRVQGCAHRRDPGARASARRADQALRSADPRRRQPRARPRRLATGADRGETRPLAREAHDVFAALGPGFARDRDDSAAVLRQLED